MSRIKANKDRVSYTKVATFTYVLFFLYIALLLLRLMGSLSKKCNMSFTYEVKVCGRLNLTHVNFERLISKQWASSSVY